MPDPNNPFDPMNQQGPQIGAPINTAGQRNPAQVALLSKLLGIQGMDDGSVSQQQLQDTYTNYETTDPALLAQRQLEMTKAGMPLKQTQAEVAGRAADVAAQVSGQANVERMKEDAATQRAKDQLNQLLGVKLNPGQELDLPGGGKMRQAAVPFPTGKPGEDIDSLIKQRTALENPHSFNFSAWLGYNPLDQQKAAIEQQLDVKFPAWRQNVGPNFPFATQSNTGNTQPNIAPKNPAGVPTAGRITGKSKSTGQPVYSDDGGKTWFSQ